MNDVVIAGRPRAVQYIRMSTEHQRYSLENQQKTIAEYAQRQGYDIVATYADAGRSGLTLHERRELRRLLRDVTDPDRTFSAILVLDVSRWGRFQDTDQHAAYEFICREMGVHVEYVAEAFANDGTFASSMLKHMKRIMAAEYCRDLSAKVSWGQVQSARRGNKQGGTLTLGLRRLLVDAHGRPKWPLAPGEHKGFAEDRVTIIPGPEEELKVVRQIFKMFRAGTSLSDISRHLNYIDAPATLDTPWSFQKVKSILTNPVYAGFYVYNRSSQKLRTPRVENPEALWVKVRVWDGIISEKIFDEVQVMLKARKRGGNTAYVKTKMLEGITRLLAEQGHLSAKLINACDYVPVSSTFVKRFGSLQEAYNQIGYRKEAKATVKVVRPHRGRPYPKEELLDQLRRALAEHGRLSSGILIQCPYAASLHVYAKAFGNLTNAYQAAGYSARQLDPVNRSRCDEADALQKLAKLHETHGYIHIGLVFNNKTMPSPVWYWRRFGSFANACLKAGIDYDFGTNVSRGKYRTLTTFRDWPEKYNAPVHGKIAQPTDQELLGKVRKLYEENGYVTRLMIANDPHMPSLYRIFKRYASIRHLYAAAGLPKDMDMVRFTEKRRRREMEKQENYAASARG